MTASKLPEWPKALGPGSVSGHDEFVWLDESLTAALARMEALVEVVRIWRSDGLHDNPLDDSRMRKRIDDLLAACERSKS